MTDTRRDAVQLPSTIWRSIALPLACIQLSCLLAAAADAPPSDAELTRIRALRKDALARPRRIWFNHDGCDASSFRESLLEGRKATPTDLLNVRTTPLAAAQVDTLSYCSISSGFSNFTHRTKVGHTFTGASSTKGRKNITQDLIDQGTDPLQVMVDFCHANDMECFWSMRMNDTHDAGWRPGAGHRLFPQLKKDHPEYLVGSYENKPPYGTWTSVNYARPEIRELCYRYIEEVCQNYDVDGVEMDFFRHLCYFKSVAHGGRATQAELDMMTEMVRRIRSMTEREGIRRGKPILVAIRVPDSVDYAKGVGLDFERWMEEGWIDCLIATGYFRLNPWSKLVELGHACGVRVYPCLSETRIRQDKDGLRARRSDACYRARAMNVWHAGADGVYIFNEYNAGRGYLNDIGAVATLQGKPKAYFASVRNGSPSRYLTGGNTYSRLRLLSPADPIPLVVGRRTQVELVIGEDFSSGARAAAQPEVVCRIDIDGVFPNGNRPEITLNGHVLRAATFVGSAMHFQVAPSWLRRGRNRVNVRCRSSDAEGGEDGAPREGEPWDEVYTGDHVMKMPAQLPWRRLFNNRNWLEEVRDGALFLADRGRGPKEWANMVYPWSAVPSSTAVVEASVKFISSNDPLGVCMRVSNGRSVEYVTIEKKKVGLRFAGISVKRDTTDAFHTYRIATRMDDVFVYIDGKLALDGRGRFTTPATDEQHWLDLSYGKQDWNRRSLIFGSASGRGRGEALWRDVKLRDDARTWRDLAFLISYPLRALAKPAWDVDFQGSALPEKPWYTDRRSGATVAEIRDGCLYVADTGTEPGDYLYFSYPWDVQPDRGATLEARVRVMSGWSSIRSDDGVHSERLEIHPTCIQLKGRRRETYAMNTTDAFHTYRLVTKGEDIRVYVDGVLRIDGTGLYTHPALKGREGVGFGCSNSPSKGKALWQWIRLAGKAYD